TPSRSPARRCATPLRSPPWFSPPRPWSSRRRKKRTRTEHSARPESPLRHTSGPEHRVPGHSCIHTRHGSAEECAAGLARSAPLVAEGCAAGLARSAPLVWRELGLRRIALVPLRAVCRRPSSRQKPDAIPTHGAPRGLSTTGQSFLMLLAADRR